MRNGGAELRRGELLPTASRGKARPMLGVVWLVTSEDDGDGAGAPPRGWGQGQGGDYEEELLTPGGNPRWREIVVHAAADDSDDSGVGVREGAMIAMIPGSCVGRETA
jgi:hypothetical protein